MTPPAARPSAYAPHLALGAAILAAVLWVVRVGPLQVGAGAALGQERSALTPDLVRALSQARPAERVPVIVELEAAPPPPPPAPTAAFDRPYRAARHASDLADLYGRSLDRLRAVLPSHHGLGPLDAELIWIGGAVAARLTPDEVRALEGLAAVRSVYYDGLVAVELAADPDAGDVPWSWSDLVQDPSGGLPWGLTVIGAPALWSTGVTGEGTVVAIIDSGVDGDHPLLRRNWRGLATSAAEAWFDPWGLSDGPVDDNPTGGVGHGTIVATVAVGALGPGDTLIEFGGTIREVQDELEVVTGAAPGAQWIAANAFEQFGGTTYTRRSVLLQSLQWALDPDGDPATPSDLPDVVNNSWGFLPGRCDGLFDRAIDALELAGVPVVFAAGNRNTGFDTVAAPANRADLLLNAFSVGALQRSGDVAVPSENSLGGPSPCAPGAVKPEVSAPGVVPLILGVSPTSARIQGTTGVFTSWAAPHAAGALALLRSLNAGASANELKSALFSTARDLPPPGLDNSSGAGVIELMAASDRIGGLGGVRLQLAGWTWEDTPAGLSLRLFNRGDVGFPGGQAELRRRDGAMLAASHAPPIAPHGIGVIAFDGVAEEGSGPSLTLHLEGADGRLDLPIRLAAPAATSVSIQDGATGLALDAGGRLGRVAGGPGLTLAGVDWLTAGALLIAVDDRVSDAAYVDVQGLSFLKTDPVATETDWSGRVLQDAGRRARLELDDARALRPVGVRVDESVEIGALGDSAAFLTVALSPEFAGGGVPMTGLLLDWDFMDGDTVYWSEELGASVMAAAGGGGPWMALGTEPQVPTTHAAVPLGTVIGGFFALGSGVLAEPFTDEIKVGLLRLGGDSSSDAEATDWAQLIGVGPVRSGASTAFVVGAGLTVTAMEAALSRAREVARQSISGTPVPGDGRDLRLLAPYPNPFDPAEGQVINIPFLVSRGSDPVSASLEIFTITGRRVHGERRELVAGLPVEPFRWNGRLAGGELAATGVYGYVLRVGGARRAGRFVLLK